MNRILYAALAVSLAVASPALAKPKGAKMDVNRDGRISAQELEGFHLARFALMDRDGDHRLSRAEHQAFQAAKAERRALRNKPARAAHARRDGKPRRDWFSKLDINRDGVVQEAEVRAKAMRRFAKMDRAGTGFLPVEQLGKRHGR